MATLTIPVDSTKAFTTTRTTLDGVTYLLRLRYVQRLACFYLDLLAEDGTEIAVGARVVTNWPLFNRSRHPRKPPGVLMAVSSGDDRTPNFGELGIGRRVELLYREATT